MNMMNELEKKIFMAIKEQYLKCSSSAESRRNWKAWAIDKCSKFNLVMLCNPDTGEPEAVMPKQTPRS